jgi:hypothetical protein
MIDVSAARTTSIATLVPDLDALVANVMAEWHIPGLALAVLRRDAPPLLQAFGLTNIETGTRVETTTLFPIGSITKSFTATGLALLVDEGKLDRDVPVREILAEFKLKDPVANEKCTLRDLLTHRTGLPATIGFTRPAISTMPACWPRCVTSIRARSSAAPSKTRTSCIWWQAWWRSASPGNAGRTSLGPTSSTRSASRTTTSLEEMVSGHTNHAAPHMFQENVLSRMPVRPIHTRPSGSICASIANMASYLQFHLDPIADRGGLSCWRTLRPSSRRHRCSLGVPIFLRLAMCTTAWASRSRTIAASALSSMAVRGAATHATCACCRTAASALWC